MKKQFRSFVNARKFAHALGLRGDSDWRKYCRSGKRLDDIPAAPWDVYKNKGWTSLGDFLGTNRIATQIKKYRSFKEARTLAQGLKLKNGSDWKKYCNSGKAPSDIPSHADGTYKNKGWVSWGDFLGTDFISVDKRTYMEFQKSKKFVQKLKMNGTKEWQEYCKSGKKPNEIPTTPNRIYKNDWVSWGDFLGTQRIATQDMQFHSFKDARKFVHSLELKGMKEWKEYCKSGIKPIDIPVAPEHVYKKEWKGVGDWLGTGRTGDFRSFPQSRKLVQSLGLKSHIQWREYCKSGNKPVDVPSDPNTIYKEWQGWGDWLGTGIISSQIKSKNWLPWKEAKPLYQKIAKENNMTTKIQWEQYAKTHKLPKGLPAYPGSVYTKERIRKMIK